MRKPALPPAALATLLVVAPTIVMASWSSSVAGGASALAATMNAGSAPTAGVASRTVTLSWAPSTLSNGAPVTGYEVKRYDASGTSQQAIAAGSCASTIAAPTCDETSVPPGTWTYSVTPVHHNWRGAESPKVSVSVFAPSLSLSPSLTQAPATLSGTVAGFTDAETITFRLDSPAGTVLSGTVDGASTPAAVPPGGGASVTVVIPAGTPEGAHVVHALASPSGETASAPVTVENASLPSPTITSNPPNPTNATSGSFFFTDSESNVSFECRLDGGTFLACSSPTSYSGLADGSHTFEVRSIDAAGSQSPATAYTWTVDTSAPTSAITFPVTGNQTNGGFTAGCGTASTGDFCGTSSDAGTGVTQVQVSIQQGGSNYWNGSSFSSATEVLFAAAGTTTWSYAFAATNFPADGAYTIRATATDGAANASTATSTFTFTADRTAPAGSNVQTADAGGVAGKAELGDTITFIYSEPLDPGSILAGWDGTSTNVVVRINDGSLSLSDTLQVWDASNSAQLPLGDVDLGRGDYVSADVTFGASGAAATMLQSGSSIIITLGTPNSASAVGTAGGMGRMRWTPSAGAKDWAGNACSTTAVNEVGAADSEF